MADIPVPGIRKYWTQKLALLKSECHAIMSKYPEAASVAQQVYKVLGNIQNLAGYTPTDVGESSEWTPIVSSAEENRENFCKALDGKPLFSAIYGMYTVTPDVYLGLFAGDICIYMRQNTKKVMFSESCSEVSVLLRRGVRAGT
jgi:hypothetical protein